MATKKVDKKVQLERLLDMIRIWIETERGPTMAAFFLPELQTKVTIRGYKKIALERDFKRKGGQR